MKKLPHPLPYQGSKRALATLIAPYVSETIDVWYEPFAGSAAMSLWAAANRSPRKIILGESLDSLARLWRSIIEHPSRTANRYREVWEGQNTEGPEYFNIIRSRFNVDADPVDLLYLCCRCVKNAVRFNSKGNFTQSVDKRRLGMAPDRMAVAIEGASNLLRGRTEVRSGDWLTTLNDAAPGDFVYMDPPYEGTSVGRDKRYAEWMTRERLTSGLKGLNDRNVRYLLSYDGVSGARTYGCALPAELELYRLFLNAGRSSQGTLNGSHSITFESLYLSPALPAPKDFSHAFGRSELFIPDPASQAA